MDGRGYVDIYTQWLRPHLPAIGRFLIVLRFLEDTLRIMTQWGDQVWYLQQHRKFQWGISHIFLLINVFTMLGASSMVILRRYTEFAVAGLLGAVIIQGFGYGLIFNLNFFLRNLSVISGLIMVFSGETYRRKCFLLAGRIFLISLFLRFVFQSRWRFASAFVSIFGLATCVMVAVGFRAKWSAAFLIVTLCIFNEFAKDRWIFHPLRDFLTYDFFQLSSIAGGLILLVSTKPGGLFVDEKKRT